jgi:hypothetical protein
MYELIPQHRPTNIFTDNRPSAAHVSTVQSRQKSTGVTEIFTRSGIEQYFCDVLLLIDLRSNTQFYQSHLTKELGARH